MKLVNVHLHQIAYSESSLASLEPGYLLLDNLDNQRPDWYEYWPIRRFLLNDALDEDAFYGFFSPKFRDKTGWSHSDVRSFVQANAGKADVLLFSPLPDMNALFLNVFEQGDAFHPGLLRAYSMLQAQVGGNIDLDSIVMDTRQIVYCNYFVARPAFWREWLKINEVLFAACEGPDSELKTLATQLTSYNRGRTQLKVFMQERTASYLLATQPRWRTKAANPFEMRLSRPASDDFRVQLFISDALKIAFRTTGYPEYMSAFSHTRERLDVMLREGKN